MSFQGSNPAYSATQYANAQPGIFCYLVNTDEPHIPLIVIEPKKAGPPNKLICSLKDVFAVDTLSDERLLLVIEGDWRFKLPQPEALDHELHPMNIPNGNIAITTSGIILKAHNSYSRTRPEILINPYDGKEVDHKSITGPVAFGPWSIEARASNTDDWSEIYRPDWNK